MKLSLLKEHAGRYKEVFRLLLKYGLSDIVRHSALSEMLTDEDAALQKAKSKAEELPGDLEKLGPTFIKLGQFLSTFTDALPTPYQEALTRLQDQVSPFEFDEVERIVSTDLGVRLSKAFTEFDEKPLSAASIAQVHRAVLQNGKTVAVKVQRPKIRQMILTDMEVIRYLAELLDGHTRTREEHRYGRLAEDFRRTILRELDFTREARNLQRFGENLKEFPNIQVPQPFDDYTGQRVLTMEYIKGTHISGLRPFPDSSSDRERLAEEIFRAYLKQIIIDGFFHADPHPGNVLVTYDGKIAMLDVGIVGYVSEDLKDSLLKIIVAVSDNEGEKVVNEAIRIAHRCDDCNRQDFRREINEIVADQQNRTAGSYNMGRIVLDVAKASRRNGFIIPGELTVLGKTLLMLDQVGKQLAPQFDPNRVIRDSALSLLQRRMSQTMTFGTLMNSLMETKEFLAKMPERANRLLEAVLNNEISIKVDAIDERLLIAGLQKIANRITMGLILAALIIGAALLMRVESRFTIFGYPAIAIFFFLAAVLGGVSLVLKILFSDERTRRR